MAKAEPANHVLLVDEDNIVRKEPHFLLRLSGLMASMTVLSGAIFWALTAF